MPDFLWNFSGWNLDDSTASFIGIHHRWLELPIAGTSLRVFEPMKFTWIWEGKPSVNKCHNKLIVNLFSSCIYFSFTLLELHLLNITFFFQTTAMSRSNRGQWVPGGPVARLGVCLSLCMCHNHMTSLFYSGITVCHKILRPHNLITLGCWCVMTACCLIYIFFFLHCNDPKF